MAGALRRCNDINSKSGEFDRTALHLAAAGGQSPIVLLLLDDGRVEVNCKDKMGYTPLHLAAAGGHSGTTKVLLEDDRVDVNCKNKDGDTPLHCAAAGGQRGTATVLLNDPRVDVNAKAENGSTPLHAAAYLDHPGVLQLLLSSPRLNTANHVSDCGEVPVMTALRRESTEAFRELIKHPSVNLSVTDKAGRSLDTVARSVFQYI